MSLQLTFESKSDVGLERDENQDFFGSKSSGGVEYYIVCDGMGGHAGGSTASRLGVVTIEETLGTSEATDIPGKITEAVKAANSAIHAKALQRPELRGMGTTVVMVAVEHETRTAYFAHVGDSRGYRLRKDEFRRFTRDHTMVQRLIDDGILSEEDAENHPNANVISRSLGGKPNVDVEIGEPFTVEEGDIFLLCSDGLYGLVTEQEMGEVTAMMPPEQAADYLVRRACEEGGHDNITVEIILVGEQPSPAKEIRVVKPPKGPSSKEIAEQERARKAAEEEQRPTAPEGESSNAGSGDESKEAPVTEPVPAAAAPAAAVVPSKAEDDEGGSGMLLAFLVLLIAGAIVGGYLMLTNDSDAEEGGAGSGDGPSMSADPAAEPPPPPTPPPVNEDDIQTPPSRIVHGSPDEVDGSGNPVDGSGAASEGSGAFYEPPRRRDARTHRRSHRGRDPVERAEPEPRRHPCPLGWLRESPGSGRRRRRRRGSGRRRGRGR